MRMGLKPRWVFAFTCPFAKANGNKNLNLEIIADQRITKQKGFSPIAFERGAN